MTTTSSPDLRQEASFRDPSGFLFTRQGVLYRQVNLGFKEHYDHLLSSHLYAKLVEAGLLIPHADAPVEPAEPEIAYRVIQPEAVRFISYPYEWSFSQLKDAAMATMAIQKFALEAGMVLKDASAYNIQFHNGKPILIDTLSFEIYHEGEPWVAYRQYCQHFLAPLALMAFTDVRLSQLLRVFLDGIPLDLASHLLPTRTRYNFGLASHIHLHSAAQTRYADRPVKQTQTSRRMSKLSFTGLMDSLESATRKLAWKPAGTEWGDYYITSSSHYTPAAFEHKKQIVARFLERIRPGIVWDLGANTGEFSRLAAERGAYTIAFDIDPAAVELNYVMMKEKKDPNLLPLVLDFTNPSPSIGWNNKERHCLLERAPADVLMALAFIHHMAISNNVPLLMLAEYFSELGRWLIVEWVPKKDLQVQKLLASRQDIFMDYHLDGLKAAFGTYYSIVEEVPITDSDRILFLMERN